MLVECIQTDKQSSTQLFTSFESCMHACIECGTVKKKETNCGQRLRAVNFIDKNVSEMDRWKFIEHGAYVQLLIKQKIIINYRGELILVAQHKH